MKIKRKAAFRVIALLMLTALVTIPMMSASSSSSIYRFFHCIEGSNRTISLCTAPMDTVVTNRTVPYACQQYYTMVFSTPDVAGNVTVTIPKESYHSDPFYLKTTISGPEIIHIWLQVYAVEDGTGTLATMPNSIDVDVSINVTGDSGAFTTDIKIGDGVPDPAGSALVYMPLNMDAWEGTSPTDPTEVRFLFTMPFPMWTTTGFAEARIIDETPYPPGIEPSMDGYYKSATGVPFDPTACSATLVAAGAGLDIYALLLGLVHSYTDHIFVDIEVLSASPVGGIWIPADKLALLAPYIALASTIILAVAATAIFVKYRKKP